MLPPAQPPEPGPLFRFGPYEFDFQGQTLTKHGLRLKVQGKPLQFLAALLERPGQTVSREELQGRLWPADTFVDFETGLNTAAKRLRAALNDSADQPVYIETLARTGYRFIAPVHLAGAPEPSALPALPAARPSPARPMAWLPGRRWLWPVAAILTFGLVAGSFLAARVRHEPAPVSFRQLTFGRGAIFGAAFVPDGQSVVYSAQWDPAEPRQMYWNDGKGPESRALGFAGFSLAAVSPQGELALSRTSGTLPIAGGELFKVPINGGVPVAVDKGIMSADWSVDGRQLAIARAAQGRNHLEFPAGRVLYSTSGWISHIRFSPDGKHIAFLDHPTRHDDAGTVCMVSRSGQLTTLTPPWASVRGLAWRNERELWFSAADADAPVSLWATELSGPTRPLAQFPGTVGLRDVSRQGVALLSREVRRLESVASVPDGRSRIVAAFDWSRAVEIDNRGRVLFDESGEAVRGRSLSFVSSTDGVARLGEGVAMGFSPDGLSALLLDNADRTLLRLVRLEGGAPRELPRTGLRYQWARYFPNGRKLLALAAAADAASPNESGPLRLWTFEPGMGKPQALTQPGMVRHATISPAGESVAYLSADGRLLLTGPDPSLPVRELVAGSREPLAPIQWSADGRWLYVQHLGSSPLPARVSRIDVRKGNRLLPWREFSPADPSGVDSITRILISPDARFQVATFRRVLSELFAASGLH